MACGLPPNPGQVDSETATPLIQSAVVRRIFLAILQPDDLDHVRDTWYHRMQLLYTTTGRFAVSSLAAASGHGSEPGIDSSHDQLGGLDRARQQSLLRHHRIDHPLVANTDDSANQQTAGLLLGRFNFRLLLYLLLPATVSLLLLGVICVFVYWEDCSLTRRGLQARQSWLNHVSEARRNAECPRPTATATTLTASSSSTTLNMSTGASRRGTTTTVWKMAGSPLPFSNRRLEPGNSQLGQLAEAGRGRRDDRLSKEVGAPPSYNSIMALFNADSSQTSPKPPAEEA
ncbi:unnamed protein product [Protopolystoma xenopodis]|uniref:Uncharacterized protein n=1 Tax=Protopolystoma xenopodis TaxID=117903 RepID=A0A3S4ZWL5_9PLAT|nr:unnamed protein product [Protopolystoma xenopodis]